jgi:phosphoglycolate phosphatase-like HAD superfamily hydrolase
VKPIRGLIWDVDGTLSDTIDLCVEGLQVAIEEFGGRSYTKREIIGMFGPTEEGILRNVVGDAWPDAIATYLRVYKRGHDDGGVWYPEIIDVVSELRMADVPMAVVTGKGESACAITLATLGFEGVFDPVACGSMEGSVKAVEISKIVEAWGFDSSAVAYIGDSPSDIDDSHAAGVVAVAAAWKSDADLSQLVPRRPDVVLPDARALRGWIDANVGVDGAGELSAATPG